MSVDRLAAALGEEAANELGNAISRIRHCLGQLRDEQIWRRPREEMNSVGNLVLHLCGNLRQWIVIGLGGGEDRRDRPAEFAERGPIARADLLHQLDNVVAEATTVLTRMTGTELLRPRRIQGFDVTGVGAIFDSVPHFRGHTQEIVHMTRAMLNDAYQFHWTPQTPEQGAAFVQR